MKKRSGRPAMVASQKREIILRFVVTKAEASKVRAKARSQAQSLSEYLRSVAVPR
jgi:hypothetical protein